MITFCSTLPKLLLFYLRKDLNETELTQTKFFLIANMFLVIISLATRTASFWMPPENPWVYTTNFNHILKGLHSISGVLFAVCFSFGILRGQIFGIERLFKRNLVRIVILGIVALVFILTEQLIENFLSSEYGTVVGLLAAIMMLGVHKPINRTLRNVIDKLIPDQDIIDDDASKVYAYQYEIAMNDGELSKRELDMLRLTAKSLGLTKSRAKAIEQQFAVT